MKTAVNGIYRLNWFMLFVALAHHIAPGLTNPVSNETIQQDGSACFYQDERYSEGQNRPSTNPCETCTCHPPDFACRLRTCDVKVGCKVLHSAGHCCPNYICDCQKDGRTYGNGEKVEEPNPCNVCYCRGGEIKCTGLTCYTRTDCEPHYVPGKCCPKYDHCPALEITERQPLLVVTTLAPTRNTTIDESLSTTTEGKRVGTLEIIEIYPENQTKTEQNESTTTVEPIVTTEFLKNAQTVSDADGLVIITAYSRVSIDSPKFTEKELEKSTETTPEALNETTTVNFTEYEENRTSTIFMDDEEKTTVDYETENSTITELMNPWTEPANDSEIISSSRVITEETSTQYTTLGEFEESTLENGTEEAIVTEGPPKNAPSGRKPLGPTLVEILLKWLHSKRRVDVKQEVTTAAPLARSDDPPINLLTALQTKLLQIANETKPSNRARSLEMGNGTSDQSVELSQQELADLAAALNKSSTDDDTIPFDYPLTDESLAPVLSMISDQLQFLKVGEEQPIYIEAPAPPDEEEQDRRHGVVIVPTSAPITVHMVKVIDGGQRKDDKT